jgi:very-short-patch-repair endonuclease
VAPQTGAVIDAKLADRCSRLLRFLYDLAQSQARRILDVNEYSQQLWLNELPAGIEADQSASLGDVLLRVPPVSVEPPPDLPPLLAGWVSIADRDDSSLDAPPLRPEGPRRSVEISPSGDRREVIERVALSGVPEIQRAYDQWLPTWRTWAEADRVNAEHRRLYDSLYTIRERLTQEGDALELVLGTGVLCFTTPEGDRVRHPLLTTRLEIAVEQASATIVITVPADGLTRLEDTALLRDSKSFHGERTNTFHEQLRGRDAEPLGEDDELLLRQWLERAVDVAGEYTSEWREPRDVGPRPRVQFAPLLLLRPRGRSALLNYYEAMQRALAGDQRPPLGLAQLVETLEPAERLEWLESEGASSGEALGADPLFPKEANPEQARIMDRLRFDNGVVVEGPPGTGKTHTIANLISALLAQGQRVLVTSQKAQALRVLRDKLPEDMQQLCVSLTDIGRGGSIELAGSVSALAAAKASHNPDARGKKIQRAQDMRRQALQKRAALTEAIRALREAETYEHPEIAPGYFGTLAKIAAKLKAQHDDHAWMPVPVTAPVALNPSDAHELLDLLRTQTPARAARPSQELPALDDFPTAPDMAAQMLAEAEAARVAAAGENALSTQLTGLNVEQIAELEAAFDTLDAAMASLREAMLAQGGMDWAQRALEDGFAARDLALWDLVASAAPQVQRAQADVAWLGLRTVTLPPPGTGNPEALLAATRNLRSFLAEGGQLRKMFKPDVQKAAEPILTAAHVDGQPADTIERLDAVSAALEAEVFTTAAARQWTHVGVVIPAELPLQIRIARLVDCHRMLEQVIGVLKTRRNVAQLLERARLRDVPLRNLTDCQDLGEALTRVQLRSAARAATAALDALVDTLDRRGRATAAPPELAQLADAVRLRHPDAYADRLHALAAAHAEQSQQRRCDFLRACLREAHPALDRLIVATANDEAWPDRLGHLANAWAWAQAKTFFDTQREPGREQVLEGELATAEASVKQISGTLATELAWQQALERMNAKQVAALQSYRSAIDSRGKGTGRYAKNYERAARDAMRDAQGAVPAWIMPLSDVLNTIPPDRDSFDVVIVDEASQASLESLFLLWLAPRVIVVGDDRQCTPPEVALGELEPMFNRLNELLPDLPSYLRVAFTPRSSLFSILRARFGQVIRLREHFRCMPEIIEWSSNMFYRDSPLVPLRQFGADRLPPLQTRFVASAWSEGKYSKMRNEVEAEALVDAVLACSEDPAYDGKTFGVVVLQGHAQVDLIRTALMRRMPRKQQEARQLRVGTPPEFQGDERHVIFLSMVIAPDTKTTSLTKLEYQRRFNVAASRAQDQVWLFHSVNTDVLNPTDLRHSYLSYLQARPEGNVDDGFGGLRRDVLSLPFESLFEQRVFLDIRGRGYQVTPQVEVNGRRIDLVVTGGSAKLAVECDGDAWHSSPEQVEADLARERELKRAGWQFWRVRESEYNWDSVAALASLWETLDVRGITPIGPTAAESSRSEETAAPTRPKWAPMPLSDEEGLDDADDLDDVA